MSSCCSKKLIRGTVKTVITASFTWEIPNFCMSCCEIGQYIQSPLFTINQDEWCIQLYPKGENADAKEYISVYLYLSKGNDIEAKYSISILDNQNKKCNTSEFCSKFSSDFGHGWAEFIEHKDVVKIKNRILRDDTLRILCEITIDKAVDDKQEINKNKGVKRSHSETDLENIGKNKLASRMLVNNEKLSDVKIVCTNNEYIYAHKAILMTRSEFFHTMFMSDTDSCNPKVIEEKDIEYEVLKETIAYIYTGEVDDIYKFAIKLLAPAQKYLLKDLTLLCEDSLCDNLSHANAVEYLEAADCYRLMGLKKKTIDYIVSNMKDIVKTPEFKRITSLQPDTIVEIFNRSVSEDELID